MPYGIRQTLGQRRLTKVQVGKTQVPIRIDFEIFTGSDENLSNTVLSS